MRSKGTGERKKEWKEERKNRRKKGEKFQRLKVNTYYNPLKSRNKMMKDVRP